MSKTTGADFPLNTQQIFTGDDIGVVYPKEGNEAGVERGASGDSSGAVRLSREGMIAIVVVVVVVAVVGICTAILFYIARKREWTMRETIRKSTRKVVDALTPRRSEFPRELKDDGPRSKRRARMNDVPPTPRLRPEDLEKGLDKAAAKRKQFGWPR